MSKRYKVFVIGPAFPLRGGPAQLNENLCQALNAQGHDAQIISYSLQYPNFLFPGSSQYETSGQAPQGIKIHTLINSVNPLSWYTTARFIKQEKPDFILFRFWLPFFGPALGTIGRLVRKHTKVLALTDNVIPHEKRVGDKPFTSYFVNACDGFLTMSKTVLNDITSLAPNKLAVYTPHPMYETYGAPISREHARQKLGLNSGDNIVLFFGLIRQYKGLDLLLKAFASEKVKKQQLKLLIAGEFYEDKQPYMDLIKSLQLEQSVILHDKFIPNDEVRNYFCAANLVAQTYRHATNSGVTMVGYYYYCPMLVTNVGGLKEIVPDNICGYVVEPEPMAIADKLAMYFEANKEEGFVEGVKQERQQYEWPTFTGKLFELAEKV